jgi:hypothetical protein
LADRSKDLLQYFYVYIAIAQSICPRLIVPLSDNTYIIGDDSRNIFQFCHQTLCDCWPVRDLKRLRPAVVALIRTQYQEQLNKVYICLEKKTWPAVSPDDQWRFKKLYEIYFYTLDTMPKRGVRLYDESRLDWDELKSLQYFHVISHMRQALLGGPEPR